MPLALRMLIALGAILLIDLYFYQAVLVLTKDTVPFKRNLIRVIYWSLTAYSVILFVVAAIYPFQGWPAFARTYLFAFAILFALCKLAGCVFVLFDDVLRLLRWIFNLTYTYIQGSPKSQNVSRLWFINLTAVVVTAIPFVSLIYGMIKSAFDYQVKKVTLKLPNLPSEFNGYKIVHISDLHVGSFVSTEPLHKAVNLILSQNANAIFFTGDLVNNIASEVEPHIEALSKISAPDGVFSTLGNHDYGDYVQWDSEQEKKNNLARLKQMHKDFGWNLLMNEHKVIKKGNAELAVIGVENWGAAMRFPKYGKLNEACKGVEKYPVKLLLSHDPSHWDAQIRPSYPFIDVTFSGHTHGMQFGIEIPGFRWSPSKYFYKQWADLYQQGSQYIYVNRGLGFLGYPGRVGILPEITVIELQNGIPSVKES